MLFGRKKTKKRKYEQNNWMPEEEEEITIRLEEEEFPFRIVYSVTKVHTEKELN